MSSSPSASHEGSPVPLGRLAGATLGAAALAFALGYLPWARWIAVPRADIWGVSAATPVGLAVLLALARVPRAQRRAKLTGFGAWSLAAGLVIFAILLQRLHLFAGELAELSAFTFANHRLFDRLAFASAIGLPASILLAVFGTEWALRRLQGAWARRLPPIAAVGIVILVGVATGLPFLGIFWDFGAYWPLLAHVLLLVARESVAALLFGASGSIIVSGCFRGLDAFINVFLVNDAEADFYPAFFFMASGAPFYGWMIGAAVLSVAVVAYGSRMMRRSSRAAPEAATP